MKLKQRVTEYTLYRYRYAIGYSSALISVVVMLVGAALFIPQGIRIEEQDSSLASGAVEFATFNPETVVNLPYHALQLASFAVFGVSEISIKLPSVLLGVMAAIGMFLLIRAWARSNVAVIAVLIGTTTPAFIFASQDGTPIIFAIASSIWLLLSATYVSRRHKPRLLWKILAFTFFVLTLYTPLGVYLCLAMLSTMIFHPHIRYVVRRLNPNHIAVSLVVALVLLSPLLYSIVTQPRLGLDLLGIPQSWPDWWGQAQLMLGTLFSFSNSTNGVLRPVIGAGVGILMLVGVYRLFRTRYTARSYVTWIWLLLLIPLTYFNPEHLLIMLPIMVIMVAMGMATLIIEWYRLFPLNPYARVFGLFPLALIVTGIVLSSFSRYTMSYTSAPDLVRLFHTDVSLLSSTLEKAEASTDTPITVVVGGDNKTFYELTAKYDGRYTVATDAPSEPPYIVVAGSGALPTAGAEPTHIATTARQDDSNRIYLYKP